jgi:peptidoglycan/xylan/chitin deacetylase (PgdA/CDA1 family)
MSRTPILCYHNIGRCPSGADFKLLYVDPSQFERQLWTLRRLGLRGVAMREGFEQLRSTNRHNLVVLTFDDGYVDTVAEAGPILRKYGFTATCYVVVDAIGTHNKWDAEFLGEQKPLMNRQQLGEWLAAGMEIGSHSCSHPKLKYADEATVVSEIVESRSRLSKLLGTTVDHFSYPFGELTEKTVATVRRAGYRSAVTVRPGIARATDDFYRLPRMFVNGEHGIGRFLLHLMTPYLHVRRELHRK